MVLYEIKSVIAKKNEPTVKAVVKPILQGWVRSFRKPDEKKWATQLSNALRSPLFYLAEQGWNLAERELHPVHAEGKAIKVKIKGYAKEVEQYIRETSKGAAKRYAKRIGKVVAENQDADASELGSILSAEFNGFDDAYANMLARTTSTWSASKGAVERYAKEGIEEIEWVTVEDDKLCESCEEMGGQRTAIGEAFDTENIDLNAEDILHPPLHPNCRCTVAPVTD